MSSEKLEITMQEALKDVNYNECNDMQKGFYDDMHDKTYKVSVNQMNKIINKMPKVSGINNTNQNYQPSNHNADTSEIDKNLNLINIALDKMLEYHNLRDLSEDIKRAIAISCAINQQRSDYFNGKK